MQIDRKSERGLKILYNAYWGNGGWRSGDVSQEDYQIAKKEGYMFDYPKPVSHEEVLEKLRILIRQIDKSDVANAFLYSLSTHRLEYRSVLGSYWYAAAIPKHTCVGAKCDICGWTSWKEFPNSYDLAHGLNVLNFERYKWGGVRHTSAEYALFDLQQFVKLPKVKASDRDKELLKEILACVYELESQNKAGKLQQLITRKKVIKSNKSEIDVLLDILGICGVLSSEAAPCYMDEFQDMYHRNPPELTNDRAYPVNRWHVGDGINEKRYKIVFGEEYIRENILDVPSVGDAVIEKALEIPGKNNIKKSKAEKYFADDKYLIYLTDEQRRCFGLSEVNGTWDTIMKYSATHNNYKRSTIFFEGNIVKKIIYEEKMMIDYEIIGWVYKEMDMEVVTENRELLIPKTSRGRKKTWTPSLLMSPVYILNSIEIENLRNQKYCVRVMNNTGNESFEIPGTFTVDGFEKFIKYYIEQI